MSEIELKELDLEDEGLKEVMGSRFIDETAPLSEMPDTFHADPNTTSINKTARKPANDPTKVFDGCPEWHPVKKRNWMDDLKDCAKSSLIFGGLNVLIFYWQQRGLMDESIALPCMITCAALCGLGFGKVMGRGSK